MNFVLRYKYIHKTTITHDEINITHLLPWLTARQRVVTIGTIY